MLWLKLTYFHDMILHIIRCGLAICLFLFSKKLPAQTFKPVEGTTLSQQVEFNLANEVYLHFENLSGDTLNLKWRRLEISKPDEWNMALCDYGTCYAGVPTSGKMVPLPADEQAYLKLIVQPAATAGQAWLWFRVWRAEDESDFQDVYFSFFSSGVSAVFDLENAGVSVFPNPNGGEFFLKNASAAARPFVLMDSFGRQVSAGEVAGDSVFFFENLGLAAGFYFLKIGGQTRKITVRK